MKKLSLKFILMSMAIMIAGGMAPKESLAKIESNEFEEFEKVYESKAPTLETAELSSTFTSNNEIEVYLKTSRNDIDKIVISGWSGGAYEKYLTSKNAKYDADRGIYTVTFQLNNIVNTKTNKVENVNELVYSFDAVVYGKNGSMSYYTLDDVQYAKNGFTTETITSGDTTTLTLNAEKAGYVAILAEGEEVTENTKWQAVSEGTNTYSLDSVAISEENKEEIVDEFASSVKKYRVLYKAGEEVTEGNVSVISDTEVNGESSSSSYRDDDMFTFEISENSGKSDWISYEDTPNVFESTIQGMHNTTATATIKIKTDYAGILSFDYMVSSEEEFDVFKYSVSGAGITNLVMEDENTNTDYEIEKEISGLTDWNSYAQSFAAPRDGYITITLTFEKDKNIHRNDDKAAIRNLKFISILPTNGEVVINDGEKVTNNTELDLTLSVTGGNSMYISEEATKPSVTDSNWQVFSESITYTLNNQEDGEKTIYVWFKNENDVMTYKAVTSKINLDTVAPTSIAPELESKATSIIAHLKQTDANRYESVQYGYRLANTSNEYAYSNNLAESVVAEEKDWITYEIIGLNPMTEYEVVTKVSDGINEVVSNSSTILTKIPSDNIVITKSPATSTLGNVTVTINWNDTTYTKEYSLNGTNWTEETTGTTTIELTENTTIYYRMKNDTYTTGNLEYVVDNIDRNGPKVEKIEVISPKSGKYGIDDEVVIQLTWDEKVITTSNPTLYIRFEDNAVIPVTADSNTEKTVTYKYTLASSDAGNLVIDSIQGGLVKDALNNEAIYDLPQQTGSKIYVENAAYIESTNTYYATIQNAINDAGTNETTIKVMSNNILRNTVEIKEGQNITLDLNGKTVKIENEDKIVTAIENAGTLKIVDSSTEKTGKILACSQDMSAYTIINNPTGNLAIENGTVEAISNSNSVSLESYAIYSKGAGIVTLGKDDGEISTEVPTIAATSKNSIAVNIVNKDGVLNFYDGILKGTKKTLNLANGATAYNILLGYSEKVELREENGLKYQVSYLSNEGAVTLTMNGTTTSYNSILEALDKIPNDTRLGTIKLYSDELLTDIIKIYKGQNVEIDLNGHTLTRTENDNGVYAVINNGMLRIFDSSEAKTGTIQAIASEDTSTYAVYNYTDGQLTIDGGKLLANINVNSNAKYANGLYSKSSNKINFNGGLIYNKNMYFEVTKFTIPSGSYLHQKEEIIDGTKYKVNYLNETPVVTLVVNGVTTNYSTIHDAIEAAPTDGTVGEIQMQDNEELVNIITIVSGKNIQLDLNGKVIKINKGKIIINKGDLTIKDISPQQTGTISSSEGIYNESGTVKVTGGTITSDDSNVGYPIYGIYNKGNGIIEVTGGVIVVDSYYGNYGIYNESGTVKVIGGTVISSGCYISTGYALYNKSGTIEVIGGTIISDGGVSDTICNELGTLKVIGGTIKSDTFGIYIKNNEGLVHLTGGEWKGKNAGIYIPEGMEINNTGIVEAGKVNIPENTYISYKMEGSYIVNYIETGNSVASLTVDGETTYYNSIQDAVYNISTDGILGKIQLLENEFLGRELQIKEGQNIEIDLNGKEIKTKLKKVIINNGDLIIKDTSKEQTGTITSPYCGIYNEGEGTIKVTGGTIIVSTEVSSQISIYGIYNKGKGIIEVTGGTITAFVFSSTSYKSSSYGIYNEGEGTIKVTGGTVTSSYYSGSQILAYGIYNATKGTIIIGEDNKIIRKENITIIGQYGLYLQTMGGDINLYDGTIKGYSSAVYPNSTIFETKNEISETEYLVNIPKGTQMCSDKEGALYVKYLELQEGYVPSDDESENTESPYVKDIAVISPETGKYAKGNDIEFKVFWNEEIITTNSTVPELKIKFGLGEERIAKLKEIGSNYIIYTYTIVESDFGYLKLVSYINGVVTDINGNNYQENIIKLTGYEITAKTVAYIESTNKYYTSVRKAVEDCEIAAIEYTNIKLVANDEYYESGITIQETQKIEVDLNGKEIIAKNIKNAITNDGDLIIKDTSEEQIGTITSTSTSNFSNYGIYNTGTVEVTGGTINSSSYYSYSSYGIYNARTGTTKIKGGAITSSINYVNNYSYSSYGIYNKGGTIEVTGGTITSYSSYSSYAASLTSGIYDAEAGTIKVTGGTITAFYGIYIEDNESLVNLTGGEWKGYGSGIYIPEGMEINNTGIVEAGKVNIPENTCIDYRIEDGYIVNYIEENEKVTVALTINEITTYYNSIQDAVYNIPADGRLGKIQMLESEILGRSIEIKEGQNVEIDLNGEGIIARYIGKTITNNGNLIIKDTSEEETGIISYYFFMDDNRSTKSYGIYNEGAGTVEITGGTITTYSSDSETYGIYNVRGIIKVTGGIIISSSDASQTCGIYNAGVGTVEVTGGTIMSSSYSSSYGIYNKGIGTIEVTGGTISSTVDVTVYGGYGIYIKDNKSLVHLTGGELKGYISGIYIPEGMEINNTGIVEAGKVNIPENTRIGYRMEDKYTVNYIETGHSVVSLTIDEVTTYYNSIQDAVYNIPADGRLGKIQMLESEILGRSIEIKEGQNAEIDLNGKEIIANNIERTITNNGELIIKDTSEEQTGIITSSSFNDTNSSSACGIYNNGEGTVEITGVTITSSSYSAYGIYNKVAGTIKVEGGKISAYSYKEAYGIYNKEAGTIKVAGGTITTISNDDNTNISSYGIYNAGTGIIEVTGGRIISDSNAFSGSYGIFFKNASSLFYFYGGKLIAKYSAINPNNKEIILKENTYLKNYSEKIDEVTYKVVEVGDISNIKLVNISNNKLEYYSTLADAIAAAPKDKTLTQIQMLSSGEILSNITIANTQTIQLDLHGNSITYTSNAQEAKAFINNGSFEIIDSVGNGSINIESEGYDVYGVYNASNNSSSYKIATFKLFGGTINVTSKGNNAYGVYNFGGTNTTAGNEAIRIEGGTINVKSIDATNTVSSGISYGIYNRTSGSIVINGDNTKIIASSEYNNSYGIYNAYSSSNVLTVGDQDEIINSNSPNIQAGTAGIYKTNGGSLNFYDGSITGKTDNSIVGTVSTMEDSARLYTIDNLDGTETTILLKELESLEVVPSEINFGGISGEEIIEVTCLPADATDVKISYIVEDTSIANVYEQDGNYIVRPKSNGITNVIFTATDIAGNELTSTCKIIVDTTPPTDTAPSATSTGTTITITCNQTDDNLDTNSIRYAISSDNGATWSDWRVRNIITNLTPDTEYLVKTKASDIAGNEIESQITVIRTKLENNSTFILEPDISTKENVTVTITWNNPEGTPQYYKVAEGEWTLVTGETTEVVVTENNVTVYTKLVYDENEDSDINDILVDNIDRLAPNGSMTINEDEANYNGDVTLTITATDDACVVGDNAGSVAYMYITEENLTEAPAIDDENWIRYEGDYTAYPYIIKNGEGEITIYTWFMDKAKNVSATVTSDTVTYNPPVVVLIEDDVIIAGYDSINEAYAAARTGNTNPSIIKVCKDNTMTSQLTIASNKNIVLDLNGRTTSSALSTAIKNEGTLEITDSLENGKFVNTYAASNMYAIYNAKNLIISGGTIEAINTTSGNYSSYAIYNYGTSAKVTMTDGKLYAESTRTSGSSSYYACGIYTSYTYPTASTIESVIITGGTIEAKGLNYSYAYGIRKDYYSGTVTITSGNVISTSEKSTAYGIYNGDGYSSTYYNVIIGSNDGKVSKEAPIIQGSTYGIYRNYGRYYFYDGVIKGKENNSISCSSGYLITPTNYGVVKTVADGIETAILEYDITAPTVEKLTITNNIDVNTQTITAVNVEDIGTGIVGYMASQSATAPTKSTSGWTSVTSTNGPIDFTYLADKNGVWYFWAIDSAGNVSETKSVTAENVRVKVTSVNMNNITVNVGEQKTLTVTLNPTGSESKSMSFTSSDESIAFVNPTTGVVTGISIGTATITCNVLNYDGSVITKTCTATVSENAPTILKDPADRTVTEGTETRFSVEASGTNLEYEWYEVNGGTETNLTEQEGIIYKSNIEGQASTTATETITINTTAAGTLSFDYMVSSEENNDMFNVSITDANGTTTAVNNISGQVDWTSYSADFTPDASGKIIITLTYTKNGSVDAGADFGAIKNLQYYYYGEINAESTYTNDKYYTFITPDTKLYNQSGFNSSYEWITATEDGELVYKSSNQNIDYTASTATVEINSEIAGTLSFDYAVSSESINYDYLIVNVIDATGTINAVPQSGGTSDTAYKTFSKTVTPDANGKIKITLLYRKDSSYGGGLDRAAIKNLKFESEGYRTDTCNFTTEGIFIIAGGQFETVSMSGANTSTLTLPGAMVLDSISGTKYYCVVSNSGGSATSTQATLTIADEEIPVEEGISKDAPTLVAGYQSITATCNQTGKNITNTYYAISNDGITYGEWQESNVFTGLTEGELYYVKTKVANANGEQESVESFAVVPAYVASLLENGVTTYYSSVQAAISAASTENPVAQSVVTMLSNEIRNTRVDVVSGNNIKLDLNGNSITVGSSDYNNLYGIYNNFGKLEVTDSIGNGEINVSLGNNSGYYVYGIYNYYGTLLVTGGSISASMSYTPYANYIYGIRNNYGTVTIGNDDGNISTTNPSITSMGYGLYNYSGTFTFNDGIITANTGMTTYNTIKCPTGYRIRVDQKGTKDIAYIDEPPLNIGESNTDVVATIPDEIREYNGTRYTPEVTITYKGTPLELTKDYTVSYGENINAGAGNVVITGIGDNEGTRTIVFEIVARNITVKSKDASKQYDETPLVSNEHEIVSGTLASGDTINVTITGSQTDVGTSSNTISSVRIKNKSGADMTGNYNITKAEGSLTVTALDAVEFNVTLENTSYEYSGSNIEPKVVVKAGEDILNAKHYEVTYSNNKNVGTATVTITGKGLYTYSYGSAEFSITARNIVVTAGSDSKEYDGTELTCNEYEITSGSLATGDTLSLTINGSITSVGTVTNAIETIRISNIDGEATANYNIEIINGTLEILPATMTGSVIIKGENRVGQTLTTELNVDVEGYTSEYQWYSNDTDNMTGGTVIVGATSERFLITDELVNKYIYVEVNVSAPNYTEAIIKDITDTENNEFAQVQEAHTPILKAETEADAYTNKYIFGNSSISQKRSDVIKITLQSTQAIPTGEVSATFDVSKEQNKSVTAWLVNESTGYHLYIGGTGKIIATNGDYLFANYPNCTEINGLNNLDTTNVTNMSNMFKDCSKVQGLNLENFDTSNVENMQGMFENCEKISTLNISGFDTRKVTNISRMFYGCKQLTGLDLNKFSTGKVTDMSYLFYECNAITQLNVTKFNTFNVEDMSYMFYGCNGLGQLNVITFNTSKVTNMSNMFNGCKALTQLDLRNFNTSNVINMSSMFENCSNLTKLSLVRLDTSKVTDMSNMFKSCKALTNLDVTKFDTNLVNNMTSMFEGCSSMTGLNLVSFNTNSLTSSDKMFNGNTALRSMLLGENFKKLTGANMFNGCNSLNSLIAQSESAIELGTNTGLKELNTKVYVANTTIETNYQSATNYANVFGDERVKVIMELLGDNPTELKLGQSYTDAGVSIADITKENAKEYMQYGYILDVSGIPVDTTVPGEKEVVYTLKFGKVVSK